MHGFVSAQQRFVGVAVVVLACIVLATTAQAQVCGDADGNGRVTVTDGVNVLRAAAGLPATLRCSGLYGNGAAEGQEECDGDDLRGATCESLGRPPGQLFCKADCTFRTLLCQSANNFCRGFVERPSSGSDCGGFRPGTICIRFNDDYYWVMNDELGDGGPDGLLGPRNEHNVMTAVGVAHWYLHILDTNLVRVD
jgi:hypothetical protein